MQFSFRNIVIANNTKENEVHKWIKENTKKNLYNILIKNAIKEIKNNDKCYFLRELSYGATLYDVNGISFTYFDYCIQDYHKDDNIRSLIYQEDGHLYTTWNSLASRLF